LLSAESCQNNIELKSLLFSVLLSDNDLISLAVSHKLCFLRGFSVCLNGYWLIRDITYLNLDVVILVDE